MFKYLQKNIEIIQNSKEEILDLWMSYDIVKQKLSVNTMDITFFKEKFAAKVFDYALSVVKEEHRAGACPIISVMLMLFKKKDIPLSDVFIICVHLKNALFHIAYKNSILNHDTIKEIAMVMDYNFEGVIRDYVSLYYKDNRVEKKVVQREEVSKTQEKNTNNDEDDVNDVNDVTQVYQVTSAEIYLQEINLDMEMIEELHELETDTLDAIDAQESLDQNSLNESSNLFRKYAAVLNSMMEFEELAYTLTVLADLLEDVEFDSLSSETKFMVDIYLKAIISDLQSWRMSIFITMEAEDIHYLDKTLMSSIAQIQMTLLPQSEEDKEEEIEFF